MIDPFAGALLGASVLALWDYGRRWLQIRETEASAARNYERSYQNVRAEQLSQDELMGQIRGRLAKLEAAPPKAGADELIEIYNRFNSHQHSLEGHKVAHEGLRAEMERRFEVHMHSLEGLGQAVTGRLQKLESVPSKDAETEAAIKQLFDRCDTNSKAIVNTAESMQKVLNEKFTALALARGVNQRTG